MCEIGFGVDYVVTCHSKKKAVEKTDLWHCFYKCVCVCVKKSMRYNVNYIWWKCVTFVEY